VIKKKAEATRTFGAEEKRIARDSSASRVTETAIVVVRTRGGRSIPKGEGEGVILASEKNKSKFQRGGTKSGAKLLVLTP